jgi:Ca-activated chloride channel family protein
VAFDLPFLIPVAPFVGLVFALLAWLARARRVGRARRWSAPFGRAAHRLGRFSPIAIGIAAAAATFALAGPRWGSRLVVTETKGLNVVLAVDISRSMLAEDVSPSRLERAKRQARRLVQDLSGDRIGLVAFSEQSFILSPLTVDDGALHMMIDALDPDLSSSQGTSLANVLDQSRELLFAGDPIADRVLVMITDGEAHDTLPGVLEAAERLHRDRVHLVLMGEGTTEPTPIPVRTPEGEFLGFQRDPAGEMVSTWRRDDIITRIADAAHGVVVPADLANQAGAVREIIAAYKRAPQASSTSRHDISRAWIPLLAAALVLLLQTLTTRSRALAGFLLAVCAGSLHAQAPRNHADEAWRAGRFAQAEELYRRQIEAGEGGDTALFNYGTAALARDDAEQADRVLRLAAESLDPEIRFRALYNLGLLSLRAGLRDSSGSRAALEAAAGYYRAALLLRPDHEGAKWNLELAVRQLPPEQSGGQRQGDGGGGESTDQPPQPQGLTRSQAEQILNSMLEEERQSLLARNNRRFESRQTRGRKEW